MVRLTHTGFVDEGEAAKHAEGWEYWLGRFKARGEGKDAGDDRSITALNRSIENDAPYGS